MSVSEPKKTARHLQLERLTRFIVTLYAVNLHSYITSGATGHLELEAEETFSYTSSK